MCVVHALRFVPFDMEKEKGKESTTTMSRVCRLRQHQPEKWRTVSKEEGACYDRKQPGTLHLFELIHNKYFYSRKISSFQTNLVLNLNIRDSYFIDTTLLNFKWLENVLSLREMVGGFKYFLHKCRKFCWVTSSSDIIAASLYRVVYVHLCVITLKYFGHVGVCCAAIGKSPGKEINDSAGGDTQTLLLTITR